MDETAATRTARARSQGPRDGEVRVRRADAAGASRQGLPIFQGISRENAGAQALCMHLVEVPPGAAARPHWHAGHETVIYVLEGTVETRYGEGLQKSVVNGPGDFLYIPANLPHQAINLSPTERALAVVARTDPSEQESVVLYGEGQG